MSAEVCRVAESSGASGRLPCATKFSPDSVFGPVSIETGPRKWLDRRPAFLRAVSGRAHRHRTRLAYCLQLLIYNGTNGNLGTVILRRSCVIALLLVALPQFAWAGYLDENPDEVFSGVYQRLGVLPVSAARDPAVWLRLEELKREPCDQKSIGDLALLLDKLGYRREAADALYRFVKDCGAPLYALNPSANIY